MTYLCAPLASHAASSAVAVTASAAAEKIDVGPMLVERYGSDGSPMILIPGLSRGPYVCENMVREFGKDHVTWLVTLPGFDARPAASGDLVAGVDQWIGQLITTRKLARPVSVGHSLGGTFSSAYGEKHGDQIGGVVAIDGLPVFPGTENMLLAQRTAMAAGMKQRMAGVTRAAFEAQQRTYMRGPGGVMDPATADMLAARRAIRPP